MVSVIIPMYNAQDSIIKCLESVIGQTYQGPMEIIVVNDGSKDESKLIVEKYIGEHKDFSIQLIDKLNGGPSSARNLGIIESKGKYIALIDSDDIWLSGKLKEQMQIFALNADIDFVGTLHNNLQLGFPYKLKGNLFEISFNKMMIKMAPSTITAVFKKDLIDRAGYYDENQKYCEDGNLWLRFSKYGKMVILNKNFAIAGNYKPLFGHSGLSGNLSGMFEGENKNLYDMLKLGYINNFEFIIYKIYIFIKYIRRKLIVKLR